MKTYFGKIVARTAITKEPGLIVSDTTNSLDPLGQTDGPETASAENNNGNGTPIVLKRDVSSRAVPAPSAISYKQESYSEKRNEGEEPLASPPNVKPRSYHGSEMKMQPPEVPQPLPPEHARKPESWKHAELIDPIELSPIRILTPPRAREVPNAREPQADESDDEPERVQHEQSMVLSKADDFMRKLLEDRLRLKPTTSSNEDSDEDDGVEPLNLVKPNIQTTQIHRLQPEQPPEPMREANSDRASLVIGKLTVEVAPSAPAPVAPRQQIIVVHHAGNAGSAIPSSRRFGLSQF